jgi:hypothetical protein
MPAPEASPNLQDAVAPTAHFPFGASKPLAILSRLLLSSEQEQEHAYRELVAEDLPGLLKLANAHHVVIRSLDVLRWVAAEGKNSERAEWAAAAVELEQARIENALSFLQQICDSFTAAGCNVVVIKSLDHWPDLGSDLDLYTDADPAKVVHTMQERFKAQLEARSWGDRLANKRNFAVPGLPELVEVHFRRLGQTGEQVAVAHSLIQHARSIQVGNRSFRVPAVEDRLMICTLQRMYRHFYVRLCDIVDTAALIETGTVDFERLSYHAQAAGIWEGVATFLVIVSDYVKCYRGAGLALPAAVVAAARFRGAQLRFGKGFLRVPILPHSARLYASQLTTLVTKGQLMSTARLSLLPCLAAAAALQYRVTGSDKGIW